MILVNLNPKLSTRINLNAFIAEKNLSVEGLYIFDHLDYALEWCEKKMLARSKSVETESGAFIELFHEQFNQSKSLVKLLGYFQKKNIQKGEEIVTQGMSLKGIYFIETGEFNVYLHGKSHKFRLRKIGPGNVVGEMGFYSGNVASASVVADTDCIVEFISSSAIKRMEAEEPEMALAFQRVIINLITERLDHRNKQIAALSIFTSDKKLEPDIS